MPKSVRQLLGLDTGGKIAFDVHAGEVVVSRVEAIHEAPAIGAFLGLLEADIRSGRNLITLPENLAQTMLANAGHAVNRTKISTVRSQSDAATWLDTVVP